MHWHYFLGNLITVLLNVIHLAMYLDLRRPCRLRLPLGLALLAIPWLAPWFVFRDGLAFGDGWLFMFPAYFLYFSAIIRFVIFRGNYTQVLFAIFAVGSFANIALILIHILFLHLLGWPRPELTFPLIRVSQVVFCAGLYPLIYIYISKPFKQMLGIIGPRKWYIRNVTPMFFYIMGYLAIGVTYAHPNTLSTMLGLAMACAIVSHYVVSYLHIVQEGRNRFLNEMLESSRKLLPVYQRYSAELDRKERTIRTLRHDLRHVLGGLTLAAQDGDPMVLAKYARSVAALDDGAEVLAHSNNQAVNAIVSYYFSLAAGSGVHCEARLAIPEDLPLSDPELVMLFGNALENCARAAMPLGTEGRITISAKAVKDCLVFKTVNNYRPGDKGRGEGLGVDSMRMLCEKHGGRLDLQYGHGEFMLTAILKLEE